ncbi:actin-related protein 2/3 complex subunit 5 [Syncephalastrum racemosum]|uniref:Actin-related protein 2/3 complex subunit 5 n=1 Tax=Syncephalastrum racemosum TaxID=13706 RepID=A0A1X2HUD5_SYNRA|nr:actin-related protein 2/3 complex subunit 5 [Syncephalastrum racemosum]
MSFRRIDIDQYDEDAYTEDEILSEFESGLTPDQAEAASQTRSTDVRNLLTKGDMNGALLRALEDPPYGRNMDQAKSVSTHTVLDTLNVFRANDIATAIKSLGPDQRDLLMKYLYAGMAKPEQYNSGLTEVAGTGCIVRVMSDKRTVF